ncbi:hypothetical protein AB685_11020 [Bacillus sp. LL01]|nr:hypothetical protein AB685_11020 [Bacillus sp. LL01]
MIYTRKLIVVEGAQTPAGGRDKGDPAGLPRRLTDRPQESEAPVTEINRLVKYPHYILSYHTKKAAPLLKVLQC